MRMKKKRDGIKCQKISGKNLISINNKTAKISFQLSIILHVLITVLLFSFNTLKAQSYFGTTVDKKDGRFISGRLDVSETDILLKDRSGLVKEISINIELWSLLHEPVEKYLFRWKKGSSVRASDNAVLSEGSLSKYPDLLKRYKRLKPEYVELKYHVKTTLDPKYESVKDLDVCGEKFINNLAVTKNAQWGSNGGAGGSRIISGVILTRLII